MTSVALEKICLALGWLSTLTLGKYCVSASEVFIMHKKPVVLSWQCLTDEAYLFECNRECICGSLPLINYLSIFLNDSIFRWFTHRDFHRQIVIYSNYPKAALFSRFIWSSSVHNNYTHLQLSITHNYTEHVPHHLYASLFACLCVCMCVKWWVCESYRPSWPLTSH